MSLVILVHSPVVATQVLTMSWSLLWKTHFRRGLTESSKLATHTHTHTRVIVCHLVCVSVYLCVCVSSPRIRLRPRILRDVSVSDTRTTVQGTEISFPVGIAPTAFHCLAWHEGEMATARGEDCTLICKLILEVTAS